MADAALPAALLAALREGRVVACIGSGFSYPAGLPSWEALLRGVVDECGVAVLMPADFANEPVEALDELQFRVVAAAGRPAACASMRRQLSAAAAPGSAEMVRRLDALFALPLAAVMTWNWDDVLTPRCAVVGGGAPSFDAACDPVFAAPRPGGAASPPPLLKLQGSFSDPATVVVEARDYARVKSARSGFLRRVYGGDRCVLHIGQSLGGVSGGVVGPELPELPWVRHWVVLPSGAGEPEQERFLAARGVGVLRYPAAPGHTEGLCGLLAALAAACAADPCAQP